MPWSLWRRLHDAVEDLADDEGDELADRQTPRRPDVDRLMGDEDDNQPLTDSYFDERDEP